MRSGLKIVLMGLLMAAVIGAAQAATITQYNQTESDIDNGAANPWTSLGTSNKVWSTAGGNALFIVNTTVSSGYGINLTIEAGSGFRSSLGDNVMTLTKNRMYVIGPFDLARYKQKNGTIMLSSNASRGTAIFVTLPR